MTEQRRQRIDSVLANRQPDLTVLAERLHKPRNFSAIVRTCDAVGHQRGARRAGRGRGVDSLEDLPGRGEVGSGATARQRGGCLLPTSENVDFSWWRPIRVQIRPTTGTVDYTVPTALLVGTELFGVSAAALEQADRQVMDPDERLTRSLNVSVACAIVLYEAMRQRDAAGLYGHRRLDR